MPDKLVISRSCIIRMNKAMLNGSIFYEDTTSGAPEFLMAMYQQLGISYPRFYKMDHLSKLGFLAAELIFQDQALLNSYAKNEIAITFYNANASLDTDQQYFQTVSSMASPALFLYTLPNILIGELCIRYGIKGENIFFLDQQFDAAGMEEYVSILLEQQIANACLCGWVDYLDDDYSACLMWVEKNKEGEPFNEDVIKSIYNQSYG